MANRDYRDNRVNLSDRMKNKIVELIIREGDNEKKKRHSADWYRDEVARALILDEPNNSSLRTYELFIQGLRRNLRANNPLEEPWNLGVIGKYKLDFSPETLPGIIKQQKFMARSDWEGPKTLNIRQAQWIARLYPLVKEKLATKNRTGREAALILWSIVNEYARNEQLGELMGRQNPDTSILDDEIFISEIIG